MTRLLLCAALLFAVLPARARESRGALLGRVTDPSGSVVAGASVKAVNEATNTGAGTTTNQSGNYELPFKKFVRSGLPRGQRTSDLWFNIDAGQRAPRHVRRPPAGLVTHI